MDNLDDTDNNAKISDSAYSNSCSNSQSRRSHSSKSTHSGSHSSGSSGYGGKPSTSVYSNNQSDPLEKRTKEKDSKKKKVQVDISNDDLQTEIESSIPELSSIENHSLNKDDVQDVMQRLSPVQNEKGAESMDISTPDTSRDETSSCHIPGLTASMNLVTSRLAASSHNSEGFSFVISMHDGVVMYTTATLTTILGFPKDMWIGRSFIDFVHSRDRDTFASQITSGLAVPKNVNGTQEKASSSDNSTSMVCRIRKYRGLSVGFGVKEKIVTFMPFLLKLSFKNINDEEGDIIYLVTQATPFFSAFKAPNEVITNPVPFVMRHAANGKFEYVDPESVPYLGYLPQDLTDKDALKLYHPGDLYYLRQVYETIVKESTMPRSKPYRMMAQNGQYLRLETEWSSVINPWSRKLEFVIAKHYIIEGPSNPDVFEPPEPNKGMKINDEERSKAQAIKESIIRIMNEIRTKPAEVAKQQMSKRCQDIAFFMENLMEDQPKADEELRLEINDADNSYYERDSVMLGGISPHHEYNDSMSSTDTPLSYNQLNYNETLQRYFDSQSIDCCEDYKTSIEEVKASKDDKVSTSKFLSPTTLYDDAGEMTSSYESSTLTIGGDCNMPLVADYQPHRLTESLIRKYNIEMEKELVKKHRETRSSSKGEREKVSNECRQKKKEHLARCNATFQATDATDPNTKPKKQGLKRTTKHTGLEAGAHKLHCTPARLTRSRQPTSAAEVHPSTTVSTTLASPQWPVYPVNCMNTFILGVGIPQQMPVMTPVTAMSGMIPMYYAPANVPIPISSNVNSEQSMHNTNNNNPGQYPQPSMMIYGQPYYGSPIMYSPFPTHMTNQTPQVSQAMQNTNTLNSLGHRNHEKAGKATLPLKPIKSHSGIAWRERLRAESRTTTSNTKRGNGDNNTTTAALNRSTEAVPGPMASCSANANRLTTIDEAVDKTDEESSYSSFYSSFFKTESGSAEESSDTRKGISDRYWDKNPRGDDAVSFQSTMEPTNAFFEPRQVKKMAPRKIYPPWMEQVCVTSELIYKYQVLTKNVDEVLNADKQRIALLEQPSLVNEQLGQLYLDLQLEGVASRLTLEEGITSSSSSGEESVTYIKSKSTHRKREYNKLVMIYEENAPVPPPEEDPVAGPSTS